MEIKAKITGNGNIKLGRNMGVWSVLYSDQDFYIDKLGMSVKGTCGKNCDVCKKECYVKKSYRYGSVMLRHAINTLAIRENIAKALDDLDMQLTRKRKKFEIVRIDQSGEIEDFAQFALWVELSKLHPETRFYIYTKNYDVLTKFALNYKLPDNMIVLVSIWHDVGIDVYNKLQHIKNIKAFVYDDGFDYTGKINIQTYCKAYDESGKLDHNITCDKCKKCFNNCANHKVIGCKAH